MIVVNVERNNPQITQITQIRKATKTHKKHKQIESVANQPIAQISILVPFVLFRG